MAIERYKHHTIEKENDGSYSVFHPVYHYLVNRPTVEECKSYIDWKEVEAHKRVALTMAYTMTPR